MLFFVLFHNSLIPALLYLFVCFCLSIKHYFDMEFVSCSLTAEGECMAQMQVSQGDCLENRACDTLSARFRGTP